MSKNEMNKTLRECLESRLAARAQQHPTVKVKPYQTVINFWVNSLGPKASLPLKDLRTEHFEECVKSLSRKRCQHTQRHYCRILKSLVPENIAENLLAIPLSRFGREKCSNNEQVYRNCQALNAKRYADWQDRFLTREDREAISYAQINPAFLEYVRRNPNKALRGYLKVCVFAGLNLVQIKKLVNYVWRSPTNGTQIPEKNFFQ